jgi:hypothetical protein
MTGNNPSPEPRKFAQVKKGAENAFDGLDAVTTDADERKNVERALNDILDMGKRYTQARPDLVKEHGIKKIYGLVVENTFISLEKDGVKLNRKQQDAVKKMVADFLLSLRDKKDAPQVGVTSKAPGSKKVERTTGGEQNLSAAKDPFKSMDAMAALIKQMNGDPENDKAVQRNIAELKIAELIYSFNRRGGEPNLNGTLNVERTTIKLSSSGDTITAIVDRKHTFQFSRSDLKKRLEA